MHTQQPALAIKNIKLYKPCGKHSTQADHTAAVSYPANKQYKQYRHPTACAGGTLSSTPTRQGYSARRPVLAWHISHCLKPCNKGILSCGLYIDARLRALPQISTNRRPRPDGFHHRSTYGKVRPAGMTCCICSLLGSVPSEMQ